LIERQRARKRGRRYGTSSACARGPPILGEVFSFNTPPLAFILDPSNFIFEPALYGSGALLIREVARRRGVGWPAILVMGAAYGILEEGVFIHSWSIPASKGYIASPSMDARGTRVGSGRSG
jgi:hypothetical protein